MFINKVGLYIFYVLCNSYLSNHVIDRFPRIEKWYWNHKTLKSFFIRGQLFINSVILREKKMDYILMYKFTPPKL